MPHSDFIIESASKEQLGLIREIAYETWPICYAQIVTAEQIDFMLTYMYAMEELGSQWDRGVVFKILWADEEAAGFIAYESLTQEKSYLRIHKLYVRPRFHKRSFGYALMQDAINFGQEKNLSYLELNVNKQNPAFNFYKRLGFLIEREMVLDIGKGFVMDDYVLSMALENHST